MAEAWNYIGYCRRQTGDYGGALGAYDEALRLKPGFPEAIEYRGHAYLGLGRVDDSKSVEAIEGAIVLGTEGRVRGWRG